MGGRCRQTPLPAVDPRRADDRPRRCRRPVRRQHRAHGPGLAAHPARGPVRDLAGHPGELRGPGRRERGQDQGPDREGPGGRRPRHRQPGQARPDAGQRRRQPDQPPAGPRLLPPRAVHAARRRQGRQGRAPAHRRPAPRRAAARRVDLGERRLRGPRRTQAPVAGVRRPRPQHAGVGRPGPQRAGQEDAAERLRALLPPPLGNGDLEHMTALLLRALRRRPVGVLARPSSVMALTLALGYASGLWTVFLHAAEGGHERNEPPFLIHWLRDSTLALPIIFMTVWLAVVLARRVIDRERDRISARMATTVLACFVAIGASLATAAGNPAHSALFGAHHGGPELPLALHILRDGLAVLAVNLPIALAVCALLRRARPWSAPRVSSWSLPTSLKGRLALRASVLVVIVA